MVHCEYHDVFSSKAYLSRCKWYINHALWFTKEPGYMNYDLSSTMITGTRSLHSSDSLGNASGGMDITV